MKIKMLKEDYKSDTEKLYKAFINNALENEGYISTDYLELENVMPFPFYLNYYDKSLREQKFLEAFSSMLNVYIHLDREIILSERFWHSLFMIHYREYFLNNYPEVKESKSNFDNIILKTFDWENYIYKCIVAVEAVVDCVDQKDHNKFFELIIQNLDVFNYIIKYNLTRNSKFIIDILKIVERNELTEILKSKITHRDDLGKDERYGRRVIFEFNRNYPVLMFPAMDLDELEFYFLSYLEYYLPST